MREIPIYELFIEDSAEIGLALVGRPAIEADFMYFNEEPVQMVFNDEKMMVKGPALIPNKLIYRNDMLGERYIYFSEDTIVQFVENLMSKSDNKFNIGHTDNYLDAILIESYFAIEPNEFNVPKNSWIVGLKIRDKDAWERIKSGEFKGYSVEGLFSNQLVNNIITNKKEEMSNLKQRVMDALNSVIFPEEVKLEDTPIVDAPVVTEPEVVAVVEEVVEEIVEETVEEVVEETVEETIEEKLEALKEAILIEVDKRIEAMVVAISDEVSKVDEKVEEFGKQPIGNKKEKEAINTPIKNRGSKASAFFSK